MRKHRTTIKSPVTLILQHFHNAAIWALSLEAFFRRGVVSQYCKQRTPTVYCGPDTILPYLNILKQPYYYKRSLRKHLSIGNSGTPFSLCFKITRTCLLKIKTFSSRIIRWNSPKTDERITKMVDIPRKMPMTA